MIFRLITRAIICLISVYQIVASPLLPESCRFYPSCSSYAKQAVKKYGYRGISMTISRLLRCNPFSDGGVDTIN